MHGFRRPDPRGLDDPAHAAYIGTMTRHLLLSFFALVLMLSPSPVRAQHVGEVVNGMSRLCFYEAGLASGGALESVGVGIAENCPATFSAATANSRAIPPTARLENVTDKGGSRICNYSQAGVTWATALNRAQICPLFAGQAALGRQHSGSTKR